MPAYRARITATLAGLLAALPGCERNAGEPAAPETNDSAERRLLEMEEELRDSAPAHAKLSQYRAHCVTLGRQDRAIDFLSSLVESHPEEPVLRIEYANAFIDKIPTYSGATAFVKRGNLARKGLGHLDQVLSAHPESWVALYCRGMNHLHWPKVLGHSDDAIADFTRCVELQAETERRPRPAYHLRTHVALGDACVKDEQYAAARQAWTRGLDLFPDDAALVKRLGIEDDESLLEFVLAERSLEGGIDTNLSFVDRIP